MRYTLPQAEQAAVNPCNLETPLENLSGTTLELYQAMRETARRVAKARRYVDGVSHVTVHIPVEIVGAALGRHRVTIWRAARRLRALGLVDMRPHKTTALGGRTVNDGALWCVRLDPNEGSAARLTFEELKHPWRDLDRDRRRGRTAFKVLKERRDRMQQSKDSSPKGAGLELLLEWSLPPRHLETPLSSDCCTGARAGLEAVLDVRYAVHEDRGTAVDGAARALASGLGDAGSVAFYRWLCWQLLRLEQSTGAAPWYFVYEQATRARVDAAEGFARRPGALFTARLKRSPCWDELRRASGRVGSSPARI